MIISEQKIRIPYDDIDKMGYLYHGNYARYFHIGRTELLRKLGICDKHLEEQNILMPVIEMNIKYKKPLIYDEIITIKTSLQEIPETRIKFNYQIFNQTGVLCTTANMTLVFVDKYSRKPLRLNQNIQEIIKNKIN